MELVEVTFECGHTAKVYAQYAADTALCGNCIHEARFAADRAEAVASLEAERLASLPRRQEDADRNAERRAWAANEAWENS